MSPSKLLALAALLFMGCTDSLVGGRCAQGWIETADLRCVRSDAGAADATRDDGQAMTDANPDANPDARDGDVVGEDVPCVEPLVRCGGLCVDLQSDALNCGQCGNVCTTALCNAARCRVERAGHLVLIGNDYEESRSAQDAILVNAVALGTRASLRVLTFTRGTPAARAARVNAIVANTFGAARVRFTPLADERALSRELAIDRYDTLLVYDRPDASVEQSRALGASWRDAITSYCRAGGNVVLLDGDNSAAGNWMIADESGLLPIADAQTADNSVLVLRPAAAEDAVSSGVEVRFTASLHTMTFGADETHAVFVDEAQPERAAVMHRAVLP
jgi:hypothetical protein